MAALPEHALGRVAVTGASGFVGRHLLAELVRRGHPALGLSRAEIAHPGVRGVALPDYSDAGRLARELAGVDVLVHLAGRAHQPTPPGADEVDLFRAANVQPLRALAQACIEAGVRRLVFASSIGVNGSHTAQRPFTAQDPPCPAEPYAQSKWEAEQLLPTLLLGRGVQYVILRPPLVYGPGCPGNFARLLALVARAPWAPLGALRAPRSFIHVDNLVDAILVAARHPALAGGTFVVSDGRDVSVGQVVEWLAEVLRPGRAVVRSVPAGWLALLARLAGRHNAYRKLAAPLQVDMTAFVQATGWRPPVDPAEGVRETARQFRAPRSGARPPHP